MEGDFSSSAIVMGKLLLAEVFSERCARKESSDVESGFFPQGAARALLPRSVPKRVASRANSRRAGGSLPGTGRAKNRFIWPEIRPPVPNHRMERTKTARNFWLRLAFSPREECQC